MSRIDYFSDDAIREDLRGKTVRGGAYLGAAQGVGTVVSMAAMMVLARLLEPVDFGLIVMVAFFTNFARMFVDAGLSMATVQQDTITPAQVSNLFWIASGLGTLVAILVAILSPVIAWFYDEPRLVAITLALTVSYVLSGLTIQHQALLRRRMQFRALAAIQFTSVVLSQGVGIAWAWQRYGKPDDYWALVLIPLTAASVLLVGAWIACPWRPGAPERGVGTRRMVSFGANLTGTNFVNYFARNADKMLIGWYWGPAALGFYSQAYKLLLWPLQQILGPISSVAVPALSRLQKDPPAYRSFFRKGVMLSSSVLTPIVFVSLALSDNIILTLLGPKWEESIPIFRAFAPAALIATTAPATHWVYLSWGHTSQLLKITILNSLCTVTGFAIAIAYGSFWVAVSFSVVACLIRLPNIIWAFKPTPLRPLDLLGPMTVPLVASVIAAAVTLSQNQLWPLAEMGVVSLVRGTVIFGISYLGATLAFPTGRDSFQQVGALIRPTKQVSGT